ncbi:auxin efflux carrier [Xylariales sp. PMI_506]|nr:auxin efflux carrier [Xylariales sp. PMI_506]
MAPSGLLQSFLAAVQASLSVLLVIFYGAAAARLGLLDTKNTKAISKVCVRMFLPALLVVKVGSQLQPESAGLYGVLLIWALLCHFVSFLLGIFAHLVLGMPDWTTAALMFNNSTSYPLLLVSALNETGILSSLLRDGETTSEGVERANAYFLVFATISNCLTFAVGPRLVDSEHAPESSGEESEDDESDDHTSGEPPTSERASLLRRPSARTSSSRGSFYLSTRKPSANPKPAPKGERRKPALVPRKLWRRLGPRARWWLLFGSDFCNAPLLGAAVGAVIGLVPALQRAFFADSADGGVLTAWLTASLRSIGGLFVPLPVVVAGVSLYTSLIESRSGGSDGGGVSSKLPRAATAYILLIRFVVWPAVSISVVYALASGTSLLGDDPILWFTMMLMPTGPPAMKLVALVQVSDADEEEEAAIAKLLTISYLVSPVLSFTVVSSLLASQASM